MNVGRHFERERVILGGEQYEACTFVDCELVFDGRPAHLVDNRFEGCRWSFEGPAGLTLGFLTSLCRSEAGLRTAMARELGLGTALPADRARAPRPLRAAPRRALSRSS